MNKQIDEMAKATGGCDYPHRPCDKCWCKDKDECGAYAYAKSLVKKGYRKIPEGAVVLTREEYARLKGQEPIMIKPADPIHLAEIQQLEFRLCEFSRMMNEMNEDIKKAREMILQTCKEITEGKV